MGTELNKNEKKVVPKILLTTRKHLRKEKWVDIAGEYHIELLQKFGAGVILVPRTELTMKTLEVYLPFDGLIIVEGEDISDSYNPHWDIAPEYLMNLKGLLNTKHISDTTHDLSKDDVEFTLVKLALENNIPYLGICRGCQVLNVSCKGSMHFDVATQIPNAHKHIDYNNYDTFRHPLNIIPNTPLHKWYKDDIMPVTSDSEYIGTINVNSYHHQGIHQIGDGLKLMCKSDDNVIEGIYKEPYDPKNGKFCVGIQFHPERMIDEMKGNVIVYQDFVNACKAYHVKRSL